MTTFRKCPISRKTFTEIRLSNVVLFFTVAYNEQESGRGITQLLTKEKGVPFLANNASLEMLAIYCHEHLHGELKTLSTQQYGAFRVNQERCIVK